MRDRVVRADRVDRVAGMLRLESGRGRGGRENGVGRGVRKRRGEGRGVVGRRAVLSKEVLLLLLDVVGVLLRQSVPLVRQGVDLARRLREFPTDGALPLLESRFDRLELTTKLVVVLYDGVRVEKGGLEVVDLDVGGGKVGRGGLVVASKGLLRGGEAFVLSGGERSISTEKRKERKKK